MTLKSIAIAVLMTALLASDSAAQVTGKSAPRQPIRESIAAIDFSAIATTASPPLLQSGGRQRSVGRKIAGGVIGGVGGFFAGGYLGAAIDGDCGGCDDPGLLGALIGAPIGAAVGAILGVKFF
jgi:hypothetical protein